MSIGNDNGYERIFILLSGGIDSTTALAFAKESMPGVAIEAVTMDYGQRHAKEIQAAEAVAAHYKVEHNVINLSGLMTGMLVDKGADNEAVPDVDYADLPAGISPTYVSFRNGLMLSVLASRAQSWVMQRQREVEADYIGMNGPIDENDSIGQDLLAKAKEQVQAYIYCGVHADDGANWAYPDCTPEFIGGMAGAIYVGTYHRVRLRAPLLELNKMTVVSLGIGFKAPYHLTWSCYKGGEKHCGTCPTCRSRRDAFRMLRKGGLNIKDPTEYANAD